MAGIGDFSFTDKLFSELEEFNLSSEDSTTNKVQDKNLSENTNEDVKPGTSKYTYKNAHEGSSNQRETMTWRQVAKDLPHKASKEEGWKTQCLQRDSYSESQRGRNGSQRGGRGKFDTGNRSHSRNILSHTSETEVSIRRRPKVMGYRRLEDLLKQPPFDIVTCLINPHFGFQELLSSTLTGDILILVIRVLSKACESEFEANKGALLSMVCQTELLNSIQNHLGRMPSDGDKRRNRSVNEFTTGILKLFEIIMSKLPNTATEKLKPVFIATDLALEGLKKYQNVELTDQKITLDKLLGQLNNMIEEREMNQTVKKMRYFEYNRPPDDFREKSLYPTLEDLFGEKIPFVRPNVIEGAYQDVEDYLDIQFRLLREDFIAPLREGLEKYLSICDSKDKIRIDNIRIYPNVIFGDPKIIKDSVGLVVQFDPEEKMKIRWEYSKRFMFGSLLLFTNDNFKTIFFGTVLERDMRDLTAGQVIVALNEYDHQNFYGVKFLMVESEVFFDPYKNVMKALQDLNESNFPMKKYIVYVENNPTPPSYILESRDNEYEVDGMEIQILNELDWPVAKTLRLDESQLAAFKAALTQEFVIIQGPPGTGKTFLGLKIAKTLLKNAHIWKGDDSIPILVVCFTNHALDQFLEGLVSVTNEIVRVGGQSKSVVLSKFNLKEKRKYRNTGTNNYYLKRDLYSKMTHKMSQIQMYQSNLEELRKHNGVLSLKTFCCGKNIIDDEHLACFTSPYRDPDEMVCQWLQEAMNFIDASNIQEDEDEMNDEQNEEENEFFEDVPQAVKTRDFDHEEFELGHITHSLEYALNVNHIYTHRNSLVAMMQEMKTRNEMSGLRKMQYDYQYLDYMCRSWTALLQRKKPASEATIQELQSRRNLWHLHPKDRWILYFEWVNKLTSWYRNEVLKLRDSYSKLARRHEEMRRICDRDILADSLVVGMTTSNAARDQDLLQALKPKIVIVEEAAEVLESHIVVSLTNKCEHVILIGDHKQLRPAPAVFRLARKFHLDVSLFERMVNNGLPCYTLENQHRMRPEISSLIKPTIYPKLQNDPYVYSFPPVRGVTKSLFFVSHNVPEEEVDDISSKRNCHEADFLIALCRYLLLHGYTPEEITILATYKGQMFYMQKRQKEYPKLTNVHITAVDNYQGEENKIILLSLVRSNEESKIGFLKTENRVCVALSRAKEGLFIIGNMDNLTQSSSIWPKIKESLVKQEALGSHLLLQCPIHPENKTPVSSDNDFKKVPEGGCLLPCLATLPCGHQCESICHADNREHKSYKCQKPCQRTIVDCPLDHLCPKLCFEYCGLCKINMDRLLPCGHQIQLPCHVDYEKYKCKEEVEVELPLCGHKVKKPCSSDPASFPCSEPCADRLPCGHSCTWMCHANKDPDHLEYKCLKPCSRKNLRCSLNHECARQCHEECGLCVFEVTKNLPSCNHTLKMKCFEDPETAKCKKKCEKSMECGHKCPKLCYEKCGGCQKQVEKVFPSCNHKAKTKCCESPDPKNCLNACERLLDCGHACSRACGQECLDKCCVKVKCPVTLLCGHTTNIPCHMSKNVDPSSEELLALCQMPCGMELQCGHKCKGSCGECMQGRIHTPCKERCGRTLICGHKCKIACAKSCPPCMAKCQYRCKHSRCNKKCGVPCVQCKERCNWGCIHQRCSKYCFEPCDIKPCEEPCPKKLKCGHGCIGFCGDTCPPLCKICDKDQVTEYILSGREDEEDSRFVYLVDCKHTIEAEGLEMWLQLSENEITLKTCPRCTSKIQCTERYLNYVKKNLKDVCEVKNKIFGEWSLLESERKILQALCDQNQDLDLLEKRSIMKHSKKYSEFLNLCKTDLLPVQQTFRGQRRKNFLSTQDLQSMKTEVEIFNDLVSTILKNIPLGLSDDIIKKIFSKFDLLLNRMIQHHKQLSEQEASDFNRECKRFVRTVQLAIVENKMRFLSVNGNSQVQNTEDLKASYEKACKIVLGIQIYSDDNDKELKVIIDSLREFIGSNVLTEIERKEIVTAVGVKQGAWFKCPNGHIYCIGECGGAMQVSTCPECRAEIGGSNHHLLPSNTLASEMDGAVHSAWPNMY